MTKGSLRYAAWNLIIPVLCALPADADQVCPVKDLGGHLDASWVSQYARHPFSDFSRDYFSYYCRDPDAAPGDHEVMLDAAWRIVLPDDAARLTRLMAEDLRVFLAERMDLRLPVAESSRNTPGTGGDRSIALCDTAWSGGLAECFRLDIGPGHLRIAAGRPEGVRAGVVRLVNEMGLRRAPIAALGVRDFQPRQRVRVGRVPLLGSYRDVVFQGNNGVIIGYTNLYTVSQSEIIPELTALREPALIERVRDNVRAAHQYGLRTYLHINTRLFDADSPLFTAHPALRGAKLHFHWPHQYVLCSEHPAVRAYLEESLEELVRTTHLDGVMLIIGGEEFYHCFMRAIDTDAEGAFSHQPAPPLHTKGRTNCARCDALGADAVVANLVNRLAAGAARANPIAEVVAWPYSASFFWSPDNTQAGFIQRMGSGTALLTEPEKEALIEKPGGIRKSLWDYSIDLIEPGDRARAQLELAKRAGIPLYFKSDHEHAYEASRLPYIPCVDRWWDRSAALVDSGADGSWVFSYVYRPSFGSTGTRIAQWLWWDPVPDKEETLQQLARSIAGTRGGPHLRNVWQLVSDAVGRDPGFVSEYFHGPSFLGPEHPMLADPDAELPDVFFVRRSRTNRPVFDDYPRGNVEVFATTYGQMRQLLGQAVRDLDVAETHVPDCNRPVFDAEAAAVRFLFHTTRTQENFYRAFLMRNRFFELVRDPDVATQHQDEAATTLALWETVLKDELDNARTALAVAEQDPRLYQLAAFSRDPETLRTKILILQNELDSFLPDLARRHRLSP
jgi:hypothetical protein